MNWKETQDILQRMQALSREVIFGTLPHPLRRKRLGTVFTKSGRYHKLFQPGTKLRYRQGRPLPRAAMNFSVYLPRRLASKFTASPTFRSRSAVIS